MYACSLRRLWAFLLLVFSSSLYSQKTAPAYPAIIAICEDSDGCTDVAFKGAAGVGRWTDGAVANITITNMDSNSITLHREDPSGPVAGIQCTYTGKRELDWVEGAVACQFPGHPPIPQTIPWHALMLPTAAKLDLKKSDAEYMADPNKGTAWQVCLGVAHLCEKKPELVSSLWTVRSATGLIRSVDATVSTNPLFVDRFDSTVVLRELDTYGPVPGTARYFVGTRTGDTVSGVAKWIVPGQGSPISGTFRGKIVPVIKCDGAGAGSMTAENDRLTGQLADMMGDRTSAFRCTLQAAKLGEARSQNRLAYLYHSGTGVTRSDADALAWLQTSANQGDADGIDGLAMMYTQGFGTPVDLLRAHYLEDILMSTKGKRDLADASNSGQARAYAAAMLGSIVQSALLGDKGPDPNLMYRLEHEESVLKEMDTGKTRVQAEEAAVQQEDINGFGSSDCERLWISVPYIRGENRSEKAERERAANVGRIREEHECNQEKSAFDDLRRLYMECVRTYKDSNVIEKNCKYQ